MAGSYDYDDHKDSSQDLSYHDATTRGPDNDNHLPKSCTLRQYTPLPCIKNETSNFAKGPYGPYILAKIIKKIFPRQALSKLPKST